MRLVFIQRIPVGVTLGVGVVSYQEETKNMQKEIDHLCRKLRWKQRRRSSSSTKALFEDDESYKPQLRTPPMSLTPTGKSAIISKEAKA